MKISHTFLGLTLLLASCSASDRLSDGYGSFEAEECVLSSEMPGKVISFQYGEGTVLDSGMTLAVIDTMAIHLKKMQAVAQRKAVGSRVSGILAQIAVLQQQKAQAESEIKRAEKLVAANAIPSRQLDDLKNQLEVIRKQIEQVRTQNEPVLYEMESLDFQVKQMEDQMARSVIHVPYRSVLVEKYTEQFEYVSPGKAMCKIAAMEQMYLRAYVGERDLAQIKTGMPVVVLFDEGENLSELPGTVSWISTEAEFTPKTIQTREERASLVYAIKIKVNNDGRIKSGMPGEFVIRKK
jgi:HlyD family secretion protein